MFSIAHSSRGPLETLVVENLKDSSRFELAPARGGLLLSARIQDRELLYLDESTLLDLKKNVRGGIPVCFPIAGRIPDNVARFDGAEIRLPQHGFARNLPWEFETFDSGTGKLTISLSSSDETRAVYPFDFLFKLTYRIQDNALVAESDITNTGKKVMPVHLGFHPYFYIGETEKNLLRVVASASRAFDNRAQVYKDYEPPALGGDEVDYHILDPNGGAVRLRGPKGGIRVDYGAFPCVVLWTLPGKPFVCVEPWTAPAGAMATGGGLIELLPGASDRRMWFAEHESSPVRAIPENRTDELKQ